MFKNFRRNKALLSIIALISGITLSGCGTSDSSGKESSEKVTLTLWHYYNGSTKDMLDGMITEFNETVGAEKNIVIDAYSHSSVSDLASALVSSANKEVGVEDMPDIFSAYSDTGLLLDNLGVVASMDQYFTDEELSLYHKDFLTEGRFDSEENLKILPVANSTEILFVNDTDFQVFSEATGVDISQLSTWEGLLEASEIYYNWTDSQTEELDDGRALFGIDSEANHMLVAAKQLGEEMYDYSGDKVSFGLSEDGARKIWDTYIVPYIKGYYVSQGSFRSDDIKSGDLLVYSGSTSSVFYFPTAVELGRTESYDITGIAMPYPHFEDGEKIVVQQGAGMLISKSDEARESAGVEFLKWFTSAENNIDFAVSTGYMPVQNSALSYSNVLNVTQEYYKDDISNIFASSIDVTYNDVLPEYTFYANKPFIGSYDARNIVKFAVTDCINNGLDIVENGISAGVPKQDLVAELIGEASFQKWYNDLSSDITETLENLNN